MPSNPDTIDRLNSDDVNDTLDRIWRSDAAAWLESREAMLAVRRLAIAYDTAHVKIAALGSEITANAIAIAALRGKLAAAELEILNRVHVTAALLGELHSDR